jgi:hypothetical protein
MKIAVMQPYLFPYLGYFQLIGAVDFFVAYDDVNYIKRGWINRNRILNQGEGHLFTLNLKEASQFKLINQISVGDNRLKLLKTIEHCYSKAPYFEQCYSVVRDILTYETDNLARFLIHGLMTMARYLRIDTEIIASSSLDKDNALRGQDKILAICKRLQACEYVNAIGGQELYSRELFRKNGIDLSFIRSRDITYRQFNNSFVPGLSIIDVIMFNPRESIAGFLNCYDLV